MQMIWGDAEVPIVRGRDAELTPQRIDILLTIVHAGELHHVVPGSGMRAICPDEKVKGHFDFEGSAR